MAFTFVEASSISSTMKVPQVGWREEFLNTTLVNVSARLLAWFPTLKTAWEEAAEDSPLRGLVTAMVSEAVRKIVNNPDGMSSETMGPFAYSKFDSEDISKSLFNGRDLKALEDLLNAEARKQRGSFQMRSATLPAAPMPRPGKFTNSYRWRRY